jgi:hypothetical protein
MRGQWGLLGCGIAAALASAAAFAATPADVYLLTVSGTVSAQWDRTGGPTLDGDCMTTLRTEGIRRVRFKSRPTRVRIVNGRLQRVDVRGIRGTITLAGAETTDRRCPDGTGSSQIADCITSTRSFAGAALRVSSPARGRLAFGLVRGARLSVADCPDEVTAVRGQPAGPSPAVVGLPIERLSHPRTRSVTSRLSFRRTDPFVPPAQGTLQQRVVWTLTFSRVKT